MAWLAIVAGVVSSASAQERSQVEIVGVQVGFQNLYKVGYWTPVRVTLRADRAVTGHVELTVLDGDGTPSRLRVANARPQQITAGSAQEVLLEAKFGQTDDTLLVEFRVGDEIIATRTIRTAETDSKLSLPSALPSSAPLYVTLGDSIGLEEAYAKADQLERGPNEASAEDSEGDADGASIARLKSAAELPTRWYAYDGVDALIMSTSRPEIYSKLLSQGAQLAALDEWLRMGGRLVLCVGAEAESVLGPTAALARFAPGELEDVETLSSVAALEAHTGSDFPVVMTAADGSRLELRIPRLKNARGVVSASEEDLPLVIRTAHGFGEIVFVATDLDRAPFVQWPARKQLVRWLLNPRTVEASTEAPPDLAGRRYGITDLAGQLHQSLDQFTGVKFVPFFVVTLLVVLYIAWIGPVDYYLVKKVLRRMEWTWFTFPAVVLAISIGTYATTRWLKGEHVRVNQVDLVDVDLQTSLVRGTTWLNVFSPQAATYNLSLQPRRSKAESEAPVEMLFSWLGNPGDAAWSGMDRSSASPDGFARPYDYSAKRDALMNLPIQVWSTKALFGQWHYQGKSPVSADLTEGPDHVAEGTIQVDLDQPLHDCLLAYGSWVWVLGEIKPGDEPLEIMAGEQRDLESVLRAWKMVRDETKGNLYYRQGTPYDESSFDVVAILRAMMLYDASGGRDFTRLLHRYQRFVDLSHLLNLRRAVLIGFGEPQASASELLRDGKPLARQADTRQTCYRFVIPVATSAPESP